jgi:hypothetical protein
MGVVITAEFKPRIVDSFFDNDLVCHNRKRTDGGMIPYSGANADYLVYKGEPARGVSWNDYQQDVAPVLANRFPFVTPEAIPACERKAIALNEAAWIAAALGARGYQSVPVPKSLYDVFFMVFRLQDRFAQSREATEHHQEESIPTLDPDSDPDVVWSQLERAGLQCDAPALPSLMDQDGSVTPNVSAVLRAREGDVRHQRVAHALNQRTLAYMQKQGMDATCLTLPVMHRLATQLMQDEAPQAQYPGGSRPSLEVMFPKGGGAGLYGLDFPHAESTCTYTHAAIEHEYYAPPDVISLFRAGWWKDDVTRNAKGASHSFSFGISPLMGLAYDGKDGSPAARDISDRDFYAMDVPKIDLLPGGALESVVRLPPLRGHNRVAEQGEFYHPRLNPPLADATWPTGYHPAVKEQCRRDSGFVIGATVPPKQARALRHALLTQHSTVLVRKSV